MVTVQKHFAGWQTTHWGKKNKDVTSFKKTYPLHCLPSSKVVFIPCDRFSGHDWNNHSPVHSPSIYEIVERVYGKAKVFCWGGGGDSTSTNHYYLNEVLVRPRYSHVTLVGGYPFLTITWMSNTKLDTDSICLGLLVSKSAISHPLT